MKTIKHLIYFFDNNNLVKITNSYQKEKPKYSFYDELIYQLDLMIQHVEQK